MFRQWSQREKQTVKTFKLQSRGSVGGRLWTMGGRGSGRQRSWIKKRRGGRKQDIRWQSQSLQSAAIRSFFCQTEHSTCSFRLHSPPQTTSGKSRLDLPAVRTKEYRGCLYIWLRGSHPALHHMTFSLTLKNKSLVLQSSLVALMQQSTATLLVKVTHFVCKRL